MASSFAPSFDLEIAVGLGAIVSNNLMDDFGDKVGQRHRNDTILGGSLVNKTLFGRSIGYRPFGVSLPSQNDRALDLATVRAEITVHLTGTQLLTNVGAGARSRVSESMVELAVGLLRVIACMAPAPLVSQLAPILIAIATPAHDAEGGVPFRFRKTCLVLMTMSHPGTAFSNLRKIRRWPLVFGRPGGVADSPRRLTVARSELNQFVFEVLWVIATIGMETPNPNFLG
jgi:hypothetical protein